MSQKTITILKATLITTLVVVSSQVFAVWNPPSGTPPSGNTAIPINVSADLQTKAGSFIANGMRTAGATGVLIVDSDLTMTGTYNGGGVFDASASNGTFKTSKGTVTLMGNTVLLAGKTLSLNGLTYSWPTTQGANGDILKNDGFGTLSWKAPTNTTITLTGDVTGTGTSSIATTIANSAVTNTKIANTTIVATDKLTATGTKDATTFLRGDNTWAQISGVGDNLGNHIATTDLQMSGKKIFGGTTASGDLNLESTTDTAKGKVSILNGDLWINGLRAGRGVGSDIETVAIGFGNLSNGNPQYTNSGTQQTAIGAGALYNNSTGTYNSVLGYYALGYSQTGSNNIAVGRNAGAFISNGSSSNTKSDQSVFLGANTKSETSNDVNEIVIGYNAIGLGSNSVILGNGNITKTMLQGNVGIGTNVPNAKLDIFGGNIIVDGGLQYSTGTTQPLCNNSNTQNRGMTWFKAASSGQKDTFQVCAKDASNVYAWRVIY